MRNQHDVDEQDKDEPVIGMGDHVPAFMTRAQRFSSLSYSSLPHISAAYFFNKRLRHNLK